MDPHQQSMMAMGAMPYPYGYSYAMPDHLAAAAAGKRSREDGAEVCRDYLSGKCTRGKNCKYIHYDPYGYGMAPAPPMQMQQRKTSIEVCLDFQRGTCTRGLECKYLHVQSPSAAGIDSGMGAAGKRSSEICKDFNRGLCTRGDGCRYIHVTIPTINQQAIIGGGLPISSGLPISVGSDEAEMTKKPKVDGEENADALEVEQLRSENQALRQRNHQLEEELAQLRAQLGMPSAHSVPYGYQPEGTMEGHNVGH